MNNLTHKDPGPYNYLKVTGYHTGLLLNFGTPSLQQRRFVLS
jgi:hypothetical protein